MCRRAAKYRARIDRPKSRKSNEVKRGWGGLRGRLFLLAFEDSSEPFFLFFYSDDFIETILKNIPSTFLPT